VAMLGNRTFVLSLSKPSHKQCVAHGNRGHRTISQRRTLATLVVWHVACQPYQCEAATSDGTVDLVICNATRQAAGPVCERRQSYRPISADTRAEKIRDRRVPSIDISSDTLERTVSGIVKQRFLADNGREVTTILRARENTIENSRQTLES
jgi:hypothetical protein